MSILKAVALFALLAAAPARAGVVINEIFYHAPDDLDDLQFIELHNTGRPRRRPGRLEAQPRRQVHLPRKARRSTPAATSSSARTAEQFKKHYGFDAGRAVRGLARATARSSVELLDAPGQEGRRRQVRQPRALAGGARRLLVVAGAHLPDGAGGRRPRTGRRRRWPPGAPRPAGTPGKKNANHAARLPPVIAKVTFTPAQRRAGRGDQGRGRRSAPAEGVAPVELRYRVAGPGDEKAERAGGHDEGGEGPLHAPPSPARRPARSSASASGPTDATRGGASASPPRTTCGRRCRSTSTSKFAAGQDPVRPDHQRRQGEFRPPGRRRRRGFGRRRPSRRRAASRRSSTSIRRRASRSCSTSSTSRRATAAARSASTRTARSTA